MNSILKPPYTKTSFFQPRIFHRTISSSYKERAIVSSFLFTKPSKEDLPKLVLFKRSKDVKNYPGKWAVCSGSIETTDASPLHAAKREVREETQLSEEDILLLKEGDTYTLTDEGLKMKWNIHPFAFQLHKHFPDTPASIILDSEHEEYRFVDLEELNDFDHVPQLEDGLKRVLISHDT